MANIQLLQGTEKIKDSYGKINTSLTNLNNDKLSKQDNKEAYVGAVYGRYANGVSIRDIPGNVITYTASGSTPDLPPGYTGGDGMLAKFTSFLSNGDPQHTVQFWWHVNAALPRMFMSVFNRNFDTWSDWFELLHTDENGAINKDLTMPRIRLTATTDVSPTSTGHAFQIGGDQGNLAMDTNEIMARDGQGGMTSLHINGEGGAVTINNTAPEGGFRFESGRFYIKNVQFIVGSGNPNGNVAAPPGSIYLNTSGGANTTIWVKESGSGNTGWVAK